MFDKGNCTLMVVSITNIHRNKSFLELYSHIFIPFSISFLFFKICPVGSFSRLVFVFIFCSVFSVTSRSVE
jgi:hypothetical protein